jgi:hypothetical protein
VTAPSKDKQIRDVCSHLESLLDQLRANVDALNAILTPPAPPTGNHGQEVPVP